MDKSMTGPVSPRGRDLQALTDQVREMQRLMHMAPEGDRGGRVPANVFDAGSTIGLTARQHRTASSLIGEIAADARRALGVVRKARERGFNRGEIIEIIRRGNALGDRLRRGEDIGLDGLLKSQYEYSDKGGPGWEKSPKGRGGYRRLKGSGQKQGSKPGDAGEDKKEIDPELAARFRALRKQGKAAGVRIQGELHPKHSSEHLDQLEQHVAKYVEAKAKYDAGAGGGDEQEVAEEQEGPDHSHERPEAPHQAHALRGEVALVSKQIADAEHHAQSPAEKGLVQEIKEDAEAVKKDPSESAVKWLARRAAALAILTGATAVGMAGGAAAAGLATKNPSMTARAGVTGARMGQKVGEALNRRLGLIKSDSGLLLDPKTGRLFMKSSYRGGRRPAWATVPTPTGYRSSSKTGGRYRYWYPGKEAPKKRTKPKKKKTSTAVQPSPPPVRPPGNSGDPHAPNFGMPFPLQTLPEGDPLLQDTSTKPADSAVRFSGRRMPRSAMRDIIKFNAFEHAVPAPPDRKPIAYVMAGGGASRKGIVGKMLVQQGVIPGEMAVHIDPDEFKTKIPEYQQIVYKGDSRGAMVVHEESSDIAESALSKAIGGRYDIVLKKTLGNKEKGISYLQRLKDAGYEVRLYGVTIAPKAAVVDTMLRAKRGRHQVPIGALLEAHKGFAEAFEIYADMADSAQLYETTAKPKLIAEKKSDSNQVVIFDKARYDLLKQRRRINVRANTLADIIGSPGGVTPGGSQDLEDDRHDRHELDRGDRRPSGKGVLAQGSGGGTSNRSANPRSRRGRRLPPSQVMDRQLERLRGERSRNLEVVFVEDEVSVRDPDGGAWYPDKEAAAEILASDDPETTAKWIVWTAPMRGTWYA